MSVVAAACPPLAEEFGGRGAVRLQLAEQVGGRQDRLNGEHYRWLFEPIQTRRRFHQFTPVARVLFQPTALAGRADEDGIDYGFSRREGKGVLRQSRGMQVL
jgi:hypothetical protein